jgi:hypothetical protein
MLRIYTIIDLLDLFESEGNRFFVELRNEEQEVLYSYVTNVSPFEEEMEILSLIDQYPRGHFMNDYLLVNRNIHMPETDVLFLYIHILPPTNPNQQLVTVEQIQARLQPHLGNHNLLHLHITSSANN